MPSSRKTRERQLAKLAARRATERRRKRRQRLVAIIVSLVLAAGGLSYLVIVVLHSGKAQKTAAARRTPTPTPSASASPAAGAVACGGSVPQAAAVKKPTFAKAPPRTIDPKKTYTATLQTSCGDIKIRLAPQASPNTVNSLVFLIRKHFFDGVTFHRIARSFVIQGGDPKGDGTGGPGYTTVDPPPKDALYQEGTVAMAKTGSEPAGTAGSQFFVVTSGNAQSSLAPNGTPAYAIVGKVISGMDVVQQIAQLPIAGGGGDGPPAQKVYIVKVTVAES